MRVSRVHRLLRMITLMQGEKPVTVQELVDELQVSRRTVFRDLNMLELAQYFRITSITIGTATESIVIFSCRR